MLNKKIHVIVSSNDIIEKCLKDNLATFNSILLSSEEQVDNFLSNHQKINTLIVDDALLSEKLYAISKNIINLTDSKLEANLSLKKPFLLDDLLKNLTVYLDDTDLFCCINQDLIYNQKNLQITHRNKEPKISLTTKENQILSALLVADNFTLTKQAMIEQVWPKTNIETAALEFHLTNLKQKLDSLIRSSENHIVLAIDTVY
jgi:hypothetical protein